MKRHAPGGYEPHGPPQHQVHMCTGASGVAYQLGDCQMICRQKKVVACRHVTQLHQTVGTMLMGASVPSGLWRTT